MKKKFIAFLLFVASIVGPLIYRRPELSAAEYKLRLFSIILLSVGSTCGIYAIFDKIIEKFTKPQFPQYFSSWREERAAKREEHRRLEEAVQE